MTNAELRAQVEELKIQLEFSKESNQSLREQLQQANGFVSKQLDIIQTETQIRKQHQDVMLSVFNVVLKVADSFFSGEAKTKIDDLKLYREYIKDGGTLTFEEWKKECFDPVFDKDDSTSKYIYDAYVNQGGSLSYEDWLKEWDTSDENERGGKDVD